MSGSVPFGANTVPLIVVGGMPIAVQLTTSHSSPMQASGVFGPASPVSSLLLLPPHANNVVAKQTAKMTRIGPP
ncbi:MAG: hypothetical protein WKG01_18255 [Kofleriaceae bacterium]